MKIHYSHEDLSTLCTSCALSIGNFDGVHLGHQAVLKRLKQVAERSIVFTFSNHPAEVLHGTSILRLSTLSHRLALLEKLSIDRVILAPFTHDFSKQSAHDFLYQLKSHIPFSHLILGHDAVIGYDRKQDLQELCAPLNFSLEYLPPVQLNGQVISSSIIRKRIQAGELEAAGILLGRPYSISAAVQHGHGKGKELGFHTANLPVEELALPPFGVYAVHVVLDNQVIPAVANLGFAPTLHSSRPVCLEVHLIDDERNLYGKELEVIFRKYIRPEQRFPNFNALKDQITQDVLFVKKELYSSLTSSSLFISSNFL